MGKRKAEFSGSWYPATSRECESAINTFLEGGQAGEITIENPKGGIVPHAGWYFSGSIACNVIHYMSLNDLPDVIAVFGMHLHPESGSFLMAKGEWETPFGALPIAEDLATELLELFPFKIETTERYAHDNTIELQLPFIKYFFPDVEIIPIGVPPSPIAIDIGKIVAEIAGTQEIRLKVIGSTDLTHYGVNYDFSPMGKGKKALDWVKNENDAGIIKALVSMNPDAVIKKGLTDNSACCPGAAAAAIAAARQLGAKNAQSIEYYTSYDKSPGESFVGYTGVVF